MTQQDVFLVSARRTPIGAFLGGLSALSAPELGRRALQAALESAQVAPELVDGVYFGNVLTAGIGQAPARQAALAAGLPSSCPATTVGKVCGSGLEAVLLGARAIRAGDADIIVSGGMESMSQAPYYLKGARAGLRMGSSDLTDGMIHDGLWDPYQNQHMGKFGELCAQKYDLSRAAQDEFARESYRRASEAIAQGLFRSEIAAVEIPARKGPPTVVADDEEPGRGRPEKFPELKPAFDPSGTITAANASSINDGAAALVLMSERRVRELGVTPLARLVSVVSVAQEPEWFTTAPATAMTRLFEREKLKPADIDLVEINEAFSCVTMACTRLLGFDPAQVNVRGGAVALGHPIGASGARILTTLLHALATTGKSRGVASICIGGGEGLAALVERV